MSRFDSWWEQAGPEKRMAVILGNVVAVGFIMFGAAGTLAQFAITVVIALALGYLTYVVSLKLLGRRKS